jgi:hypothetical protein
MNFPLSVLTGISELLFGLNERERGIVMKQKTIYIHIGSPKTGTKSIQRYLESNEERLYQDGYLVPKTSRRHLANHTLLTNYCIRFDHITEISILNDIWTKKELKKFRRVFRKKLRDEIQHFHGNHIVFSNEQCYEKLKTVEELEKLKALFQGLDYQIKIIVYIREQTDMLCSFYSAKMKQGKTYLIDQPSEFAQKTIYDYNQKLKLWEEVFGIKNIMLRVFDREKLYDQDIVSDFCYAIQFPRYDDEAIRMNTSLNAKQCEYLRIVNEYIPHFRNYSVNENRAGLVELVAEAKVDSPAISTWISKDYLCVYEESNKELINRYFGEPTPIFQIKPLPDKGQAQVDTLSQEDKRMITSQIIRKHKVQNEILCKSLAAIFEVEYENKKIPMEYVYSHHSPWYDQQVLGKSKDSDLKPDQNHYKKRLLKWKKKLFNQ